MAEKRKDSKGRVLKTGESQRKDGTYMYRYIDAFKKRKTIYAPTITELREKENQIVKKLALGIASNDVTVRMMVERYEAMQINLRAHTSKAYKNFGKIILKSELADAKIDVLTASAIKLWLIGLYESGYAPGTVYQVCGYFKRVLNIAVEDSLLGKNPISFRRDFLPEKQGKKDALTIEQQETILEYVKSLPGREATYDYIVVLLGTGLRIGEFMGLTIGDLDFENNIITINKQMCAKGTSGHYIAPVKTESGNRKIPMSSEVRKALERMVLRQKKFKIARIVDGYSGFVFVDSKGNLQNEFKFLCALNRITDRYTKETQKTFPHVTPHIFRHTFCTNMANAGMPPVALQYLMGHANATMTFGVYTHSGFENAQKAFEKVMEIAAGE